MTIVASRRARRYVIPLAVIGLASAAAPASAATETFYRFEEEAIANWS